MSKNPRYIKKPAPVQNSIISNTVREGKFFADVAKASCHSEIANPVSPRLQLQNSSNVTNSQSQTQIEFEVSSVVKMAYLRIV